MRFLLLKNANPNSRGVFMRTPLSRAASQDHIGCMEILLENGADPRICMDMALCSKRVTNLIKSWDIDLTNKMLRQFLVKHIEMKTHLISGLECQVDEAFKEYEKASAEYEQARDCLNVRKKEEKNEALERYKYFQEQNVNARYIYKDLVSSLKIEKKYLIEKRKEIGDKPHNNETDW